MTLLVACLCAALSLVAAGAAVFAAVWARSGAHKVDDLAAIVIPLLSRVQRKVDPDPMVASVVAAAAAAPPPAIIEPMEPAPEAAVTVAPLPVIATEDEDERRESAPLIEPDEHSPTIPMPPVAPGAGGDQVPVAPPETGPSRSGERRRDKGEGEERPAGYFLPYVVPAEPSSPDTRTRSSMEDDGARTAGAVADRRRRAHELGQATERRRQVDARKTREADELARRVGVLSEDEAARPSGEGFAMDRPSWDDGLTAIHDKASLQAAMQPPPAPVPIGRIVPGGRVPPPPRPRAKADSSPTLTSQGIAPGPRQRFDPRVEPESCVEVQSPQRRGQTTY